MFPTLHDGDTILLETGKFGFNVGSVYGFKRGEKYVIKRLLRISQDRLYFVGDNPKESIDSRNYGEVSKNCVIGKVITLLLRRK